MSLVYQLFYKGENGRALQFMAEMESSGIAATIRRRSGNLGYDYFQSQADPETLLLIDEWENQAALDAHHASPEMAKILALREKYGITVTARRLVSDDGNVSEVDRQFVNQVLADSSKEGLQREVTYLDLIKKLLRFGKFLR